MFNKVRLRLTLVCAVSTGLVLIAMAAVSLRVSTRQMQLQFEDAYTSDLHGVLYSLQGQSTLSHTWLAQTEATNGMKIGVFIEEAPLLFTQLDDTRYALTLEARNAAQTLGFDPTSPPESTLRTDFITFSLPAVDATGTTRLYRAAVASVPGNTLSAAFQQTNSITLTQAASPGEVILPEENTMLESIATVREEVLQQPDPYATARITVLMEDNPPPFMSVAILQDTAPEQAQLHTLRITFIASTAVALLALCLFAWFFSRWAMRPAEEGHTQQVEFVSAASHELRAPLAVIQASIGAMQNAPPEQAARFMETIANECGRMRRLTDDLLDIARADSRSWGLEKSAQEPETLLLLAYERYELPAKDKQIRLNISLPAHALTPIQADPVRIAQVLDILLNNALSYTPAGSTVQLALLQHKRSVRFVVEDDGPGIPDAQKPMVFRRFFRGDASRSEKHHAGLGLSIAQEIAELHGGSLLVEDAPGGGARFVLQLPITHAARE